MPLQPDTGEGDSENVHDKYVKEEADALLVEFLTMAASIRIRENNENRDGQHARRHQ